MGRQSSRTVEKRQRTGAVQDLAAFLPELPREFLRAFDPHAVAFALKGGRVRIVVDHFPNLSASQLGLAFGSVELGQLYFRPGIGMIVRNPLPGGDGGVRFAERAEGFGQRHQRMAIVVFRILRDDTFENGPGFLRLVLAEQALAEMGAGIDVLRVALERGAVSRADGGLRGHLQPNGR